MSLVHVVGFADGVLEDPSRHVDVILVNFPFLFDPVAAVGGCHAAPIGQQADRHVFKGMEP